MESLIDRNFQDGKIECIQCKCVKNPSVFQGRLMSNTCKTNRFARLGHPLPAYHHDFCHRVYGRKISKPQFCFR